jgi:putative flippase GtrA
MTRWTRFAGVGFMGFIVQLVTLSLLTSVLHLHHLLSVALAVEAAILHNFVWHERWTWRDRSAVRTSRADVLDRLLRFNAASGAVSLVGNLAFTALFLSFHLPVLVANVAAVGCLTAISYLVADRFAYGPARASGRATAMRRLALPRSFFVWLLVATAVAGHPVHAAELTPEILAAWNRYVAGVESRRAQTLRATSGFLSIDGEGDARKAPTLARLRQGEIVVDNVAGGTVDLGAGTVSHWRGLIFIPGVTVSVVVESAALRGRTGVQRQEDVLESRVLNRDGDSLRLFLKLQRRAVLTVAYNTEHLVSFQRLGDGRAESRSISTRIAELRDAGTVHEAEKPVGQDRGFLWRLHSYWRYRAVPGGVIVELESLTLSRDIPWAIRAMAAPIIDRTARESMSRTLTSLRERFQGATAD